MNRSHLIKVIIGILVLSMVLTACGSGAAQPAAPAASDNSGASSAEGEAQLTASSGFVCPVPNPKMDVKSKELNLFVWTEYIPTDMTECFEKVYNIKVNRDEYSSNEEMYAKISAGGTNYDLVQPTDYIVSLMIRQKLLQQLDQSKLPNMKNYDSFRLEKSRCRLTA
ncbi:MAG: hypothetical protein WCP19_08405, partial [Chloroflexota bacterium]